ncbi:MAG: hypothetical protein ACO28O_02295 [Crocinitomicaceae bacterium]|jgi:hypothetical protein
MIKRLLVLLLLISLFSCNEKVDLIGDYKETAVVYGLLDHADSLHYIKITRAFIGPGSAVDIAQNEDSSYFQQVEARVTEVVGGTITRTWLLDDTIVTNKDINGAFYAPEQKVYYFKTLPTGPNEVQQISANPLMSSLNKDATYKLNIKIDNGKFEVNGETELVRGLTSPSNTQNFTFKFANNPGEYLSQGVAAVNTFGNSFVVNAAVDVYFNEYIGVNKSTKSFQWKLGETNIIPGESRTFTAYGETFYTLMKKAVTPDPAITRRTFEGVQFTITGGSEALYNYMVVNAPSSSLSQSKPTYTNLTVTNGKGVVGIFSSRQTLRFYRSFFTNAAQAYIRAIDKKSTRELCLGPITGLLLFCSNHPGDNVVGSEESYACQ